MVNSIVTANRLADGVVVWLDSAEAWVEGVDAAAALAAVELQTLQERLGTRDRDVVIDIRSIPVDIVEGRPIPQARRERLRGAGPSVRDDLAGTAPGDRWARPPLPEPPSATATSPYAGIYRYDEYDRQFLRDRAEQFRGQVQRRLWGELSEDEFKPLRLMNGLYLQLHGYMLRVALAGDPGSRGLGRRCPARHRT